MVTKLTYGSGLGEGISSLGTSLGQAMQAITKKQRLDAIMKPYSPASKEGESKPQQQQADGAQQQPDGTEQPDTILKGVTDRVQKEVIPVAEEQYNNKLAEINHKKNQAAKLEAEGYHPQAKMMMQEAQHQETFLQQERLQDKKLTDKVSSEADKRAFEENKPYATNLENKRQEQGTSQATLLSIRDNLIKSDGKIGNLRNLISTFAPFDAQDYIKTANAQQLSSFVKDFFVADLKGMPGGSKLNQLIEKNLLNALQNPGKTEESNQKITEFQQYKQDVIEKELEIYDRIRGQYLKAGREPPRGMQQKVHEQLKPYVMEQQKELIQTYADIDKGKFKSAQMLNMPFAKSEVKDTPAKPGFTWVMSPDGKPVQAPNNELDQWLNGGGKLIR